MDTKSRARRCYTIQAARISSSALPPRDLVLHHKYLRRVGVNGPMLKLTFISFIHPAKSAAMRQAAGSQKCPFEDALWFTLCNAASLSWPFSSHEGSEFMLETSAQKFVDFIRMEKKQPRQTFDHSTPSITSQGENWEYFFILKIMSRHLKFDRKLLEEVKLHS